MTGVQTCALPISGIVKQEVVFTPFEKAIKHHKDINKEMLEMSRILAL